jgi:hypothetical protein
MILIQVSTDKIELFTRIDNLLSDRQKKHFILMEKNPKFIMKLKIVKHFKK